VEDELDEVDSIVVDDAVRELAELNASYLVVGDVNTWAIGSALDSKDRGGQSPGSTMSATVTPEYHDARIGCGPVHQWLRSDDAEGRRHT
jgi:hypothetical protein